MTRYERERKIIECAAQAWGITTDDLLSGRRWEPIPTAKRMASAALASDMRYTQAGIARAFGLANHTTIHHHLQRHRELMATDHGYRRTYARMWQAVRGNGQERPI